MQKNMTKIKVITVIHVEGTIAIFALDDSRVVASLAAVPSFHFHALVQSAATAAASPAARQRPSRLKCTNQLRRHKHLLLAVVCSD